MKEELKIILIDFAVSHNTRSDERFISSDDFDSLIIEIQNMIGLEFGENFDYDEFYKWIYT
jgi:hypothetical protein